MCFLEDGSRRRGGSSLVCRTSGENMPLRVFVESLYRLGPKNPTKPIARTLIFHRGRIDGPVEEQLIGPVVAVLRARKEALGHLVLAGEREFLQVLRLAGGNTIAVLEPLEARGEAPLAGCLEVQSAGDAVPLGGEGRVGGAGRGSPGPGIHCKGAGVLAVVEIEIGVELGVGRQEENGVIEVAPAGVCSGIFRSTVIRVAPGEFGVGDGVGKPNGLAAVV